MARLRHRSVDLKLRFPDIGVSPRNLWHMKRFYERSCNVDSKLQRNVAVLPWRHNLLLLEKVTDDKEALYYAEKAIDFGWTRDIPQSPSFETPNGAILQLVYSNPYC